jgi:hypothetical protein
MAGALTNLRIDFAGTISKGVGLNETVWSTEKINIPDPRLQDLNAYFALKIQLIIVLHDYQ